MHAYLQLFFLCHESLSAEELFIFSHGREEHLRTPQLHTILSAERDPLFRELHSLSHPVQSHGTPTVVGEIHRQFAGGVIHGHGGDNSVHHLHGGLLLRIKRADKDIHRRQLLLAGKLLRGDRARDRAPPEGLVVEPELGEDGLSQRHEKPWERWLVQKMSCAVVEEREECE